MLPHPTPEEVPVSHLVPPFSHFQGFSAPASSHRHINNTCGACLSDERVSPRTAVPYHDHQNWKLPRQHMEQLSDVHDDMPSTDCRPPRHHAGGLVQTHKYHHGLSRPERGQQLSKPPTYITPPPQYFSSPENVPALAFEKRPVSLTIPSQGTPANPLPVPNQHHVSGRNTIRVPSNSDVSDAGQQPLGFTTAVRPLTANERDEPTSILDDYDDANSTVYPYDSTTTVSSSAASRATRGGSGASARPLEEAVVEVHNICLATTQRYLESLCVNWELRHGRKMFTTLPGIVGPTRHLRDRAGIRGSPYSLPQRRNRRALSHNSGLEYVRRLRGGDDAAVDDTREEGRGQSRRREPPACPVPAPTESLLQNTSRICELIWRQARRDREDVLGAEAGGARRMALLVESAEAVVLGDAAEWQRDPETAFRTACRAGRDFCREMRDLRGVERVECIERGDV